MNNKSLHAGLALFSAVIFLYSFCFVLFYIPHSLSNIGFYEFITFSNSLDPCGIILSLFYSHIIHSNVYTSLVWRCVYLNNSDLSLRYKNIHVTLTCTSGSTDQTHNFQVLRNGMYLSSCFYFCFFWFY